MYKIIFIENIHNSVLQSKSSSILEYSFYKSNTINGNVVALVCKPGDFGGAIQTARTISVRLFKRAIWLVCSQDFLRINALIRVVQNVTV